MTATEAVPAEISQKMKVTPEMNLEARMDIRNETFKGILSFLIEDTVSGKILKKMEVKDTNNRWQTLQMRFQSKSSKIRIRLSARGEGMLQADNIAVTFPQVVPPLQEVKWLSTSESFSIPSRLRVSVQGQSGRAIDGGLELLGNDLKKYGVVVEKTEPENSSFQILIGAKYEVKGKGDESYVLAVNKKGITIKAGKEAGAFYGLMSVLQLIEEKKDKPVVLACDVTDYPDLPMRGIFYGSAEQAARWKMNTVKISTGYVRSGTPELDKYKQDFTDRYLKCRKLNLDVMPHFQTLSGSLVQRHNPNLFVGIWVRDERITLHALKPSHLAHKRVIRTTLTDVSLTSLDGKIHYKLGKDYEVVNGDTQMPYIQGHTYRDGQKTCYVKARKDKDAKPFAVCRLPGSSIPDGATVLADYDYVSHKRKKGRGAFHIPHCPIEPQAREIMGNFMEKFSKDYPFSYINIENCLEEFGPRLNLMSTDSRIIKSGMRPVDMLAEYTGFLDKAAKRGNPKVRLSQWARSVNETVKVVGPKLPKDTMIMVWGYTPQFPFGEGTETISFFAKLGLTTSVMSMSNIANIRGWAQVVAEARKKGCPCLGMFIWDARHMQQYKHLDWHTCVKETASVSWKVPKKGDRRYVERPPARHEN